MARALRTDFPEAWHHVMNRGARRAPIFRSDDECLLFLGLLADLPKRFGIEVHAYALMPNHYHLLAHSRRGLLSRAMRHLNGTFTLQANQRARHDGPIFRGRFTSKLVRDDRQLLTVASYIHLNPLRAQLVRRLDAHAWTSHRAYVGLETAPEWLSREPVLKLAGGAPAFDEYVNDLRTGRRTWPGDFDVESGFFQAQLDAPPPPRVVARDAGAEGALASVTALTGFEKAELRASRFGPGGNPARRFAAWALGQSTDLTQAAIGRLLDMTPGQVAQSQRRVARAADAVTVAWREGWDAG